jgi:hypothetical protein
MEEQMPNREERIRRRKRWLAGRKGKGIGTNK